VPKKKPIEFASDRPAYDRQPGEPDKQWFAFTVYRDLVDRALKPVAQVYQKRFKGKGQIKGVVEFLSRQSVIWRWRDRCAEWDRTLDERRRNRKLRAVTEMEERHLDLARKAGQAANAGLNAIVAAAKEAERNGVEHLSVKEVLGLATFGIGTERVIQGQPATIEEQRHTISTDDKRAALQKLASDPALADAIEKKIAESREDPDSER
jgi:hypothetical protein